MLTKSSEVPQAKVKLIELDGATKDVDLLLLSRDKKIVVFVVPGPFTPTCSQSHLPGFVVQSDKILARGVERIYCMSVADHFVMKAWSSVAKAAPVLMLADGNGDFARAAGMEIDLSAGGLGMRSKRYAMIIENGIVLWLGVDDNPGEDKASSAEAVLAQL